MLLTKRCNFKCPYCRGINGDDITHKNALSTLSLWADNQLKNVRFSGGEPTLHNGLIDFVAYCKSKGVERIAISTNGSAGTELYMKLFGAGVNDFSISLDGCCANTHDTMSGTRGMFDTVVDNIRELSKRTYVTVGMVYNEMNKDSITDSIAFVHSLGVSDIRIIPSAQYGKEMNLQLPEWSRQFPILTYRTSGSRLVRGLSSTDCPKCKLVLDDMAVWGGYHYPCIIYLRENGKPIGKVSSDMRQERLNWYNAHNSFNDAICRTNCLDVCVEHNNCANIYP